MDLTGRETLEVHLFPIFCTKNYLHFQILAQMHGYIRYKNKAIMILESVGLVSHADKLVRYYR